MMQMKCFFCERAALYDFGFGHVLCAACLSVKVLAHAKIKSSFPVGHASSGEQATAVDNPAGLPAAVADHFELPERMKRDANNFAPFAGADQPREDRP